MEPIVGTKSKKIKIPKKATLDALWSKKVKEKAGYQCEICGINENLNSHHVISRNNHATRWLLENGVCLCVSHHIGPLSAHKNPLWFMSEMIRQRSVDWRDNLLTEASKIFQWKKNIDKIKAELNG